jgi:hypothetical protein
MDWPIHKCVPSLLDNITAPLFYATDLKDYSFAPEEIDIASRHFGVGRRQWNTTETKDIL